MRVAAEGNSLEASYSTGGAAGGRSGAAQLREGPAGAAQAPLDAVATPADSGAVLQEAADYMRGELRRMFTTGVRKPSSRRSRLALQPSPLQRFSSGTRRMRRCSGSSSSSESACVLLLQQAITRQRYDANIRFQDPVVRLRGRDAYIANVQLLNMLFAINFEVLSLKTSEPDHIDVRCAVLLRPRCRCKTLRPRHHDTTWPQQSTYIHKAVPVYDLDAHNLR